jgi:hypothetical protein
MADKKISELPLLNSVSGSSIIVPLVHDGTTNKLNLSQIAHYTSQWSAKTGSANTFTGNQSVIGNVDISGKLTVNSIEAVYETSSILYTSGSTQIGDQITDVHTIVGTINLNGLALGTNELMAQTASQAAVNLRISSTTGSINTTTSSFDLVFLGISSVTGSINVQSSSQDLVNRGISSVTGAINTTTSSFDSEFGKIGSTTASLHFTTSSLNAFTGSIIGQNNTISTFTSSVNFATQSLNTQTGSQDLVNRGISSVTGSINTTTSSFDSVFLRISSTTGSINTTTSSFDSVFLRISSTTGSINTTTSSFDSVFLGISSVTGSLIGITNTLMAFTAALDNTYATDAQLYQLYQATASIHSATSSLNTQTGSQDLVNRGISSVTGSINTTTSSFNSVFLGISSVTGAINTQSSSQDFVNRGISSVTGSINLTTASLIGITNGLMAFTAALDNTYATDAQLYQLYQATASIHFATSSLNSFSGSIRGEVNGLEAYTASLKAAAIVSSSTQITNYYKFAETASANTFYGTQTINGNLQLSSTSPLVYNAGNTNAMLFGFFDGSSIYGPYYQIFGSNYSNTTQRGSAEFVFDSRNGGYSGFNIAEFNGSTWLRKFRVSPNGAEVTGSFVVDGGITGSLMATNNVVSSSTQIQNYNLFAVTSSANTFYGNQTFASNAGNGLRIYGGSGTHQWDAYLNGQNLRLSDNTSGDGAFVVDTRASFGGHITGSGNLYIGGALQVQTDAAAITLKQTGTTAGTGIYLERNGEQKGYYIYLGGSTDNLTFQRNNAGTKADVMALSRDGDVTISTGNLIMGTSGKGIDFSATSNGSGTTTSELLNDYEEGTWTPGLSAGTSGTITVNTGNSKASYTKIGRAVTLQCFIEVSSVSSPVGRLSVTGFPFTAGSNLGDATAVVYNTTFTGNPGGWPILRVQPGTFGFIDIQEGDGTNPAIDLADHITTGTELIFSVTYFV